MKNRLTHHALAVLLFSSYLGIGTVEANALGNLSEWFHEILIDPQDGMLDSSDYLASRAGFLPIPIIVTEPAVGFGIGAAVAFFHQPKELDSSVHGHEGPPSISVGFAARTDNETYLVGGAHSGVWKDDHVRYLGVIAKVSVNLKFYPSEGPQEDPDSGIRFNVDGTFFYQRMQFRLRESNWWLGANYLYINADNTFRIDGPPEDDLPDPRFGFEQGGVGAFVEYDGRNTTFTPSDGLRALLEYRNYDKNWGSDFNYDHLMAGLYHYTPFGAYSSLGIRLVGEKVSGDVPFFGYPYVNLRGIPALRYQGEEVMTGELEYLWGLTPRWTLVLFGGVGKTSDLSLFGNESETVGAGGLGFRYRLARKMGLQAGLDLARGPEDTAIYLTVGSAW
jgi:hypothetical protein